MKGLKKIALVSAIAAAPFAANADLKALDDSAIGNVTGQAGVTIELETRVDIGKFTYTDEGSFEVNNISIGGETVGGGDVGKDNLDNLALVIDVEADGDAVIHVATLEDFDTGSGYSVPVPIDFGMSAGDMNLVSSDGSQSTTLLSNLKMHGDLAALDIRVDTEGDNSSAGVGDVLGIDAKFDVDNLEVDVPFLAVGIRGMVITGSDDEPEVVNDGVGAVDYAVASLEIYKGTAAGVVEYDATGAVTGRDNENGDALVVAIDDISMDVYIDQVLVGGTVGTPDRNIGSIAMDNLQISNTTLKVYGH